MLHIQFCSVCEVPESSRPIMTELKCSQAITTDAQESVLVGNKTQSDSCLAHYPDYCTVWSPEVCYFKLTLFTKLFSNYTHQIITPM